MQKIVAIRCGYAADYGLMITLFTRTARAVLASNAGMNGSAWLAAHLDTAVLVANYTLALRTNATQNTQPGTVQYGLIFGPPEHDTCHEPGV